MDATVRFYDGVLGARLVADLGNRSFRHYFFEFGPATRSRSFELPGGGAGDVRQAAGVPDSAGGPVRPPVLQPARRDCPAGLRDRLKAAGCEVTDLVDHGFLRSIYFTDPNGIALEASYWVTDPTGRPADYADEGLFADPDPVPRRARAAVRGPGADGSSPAWPDGGGGLGPRPAR